MIDSCLVCVCVCVCVCVKEEEERKRGEREQEAERERRSVELSDVKHFSSSHSHIGGWVYRDSTKPCRLYTSALYYKPLTSVNIDT